MEEAGLRVPDDVGPVCFGDPEFAASMNPCLTVHHPPAYEMERAAMEMLSKGCSRQQPFALASLCVRIHPQEFVESR
jgi:DNA-binding LacI/PurR family transcriptional regulator